MKLFIPGPTDVREDVLQAMARPPISHRGEEIAALHRSIVRGAQEIFRTRNTVLLSTSSATGLMEAAVRNVVGTRVLCAVNGAFSERWHAVAVANGKEADRIEVPWGRAIDPADVERRLAAGRYDALTVVHSETSTGVANPIAEIAEVMRRHPEVAFLVDTVSSLGGMPVEVDGWGIDLCLASVQKCLALPPGFALCSVSEKVLERSRRAKDKGWYFDLARLAERGGSGQSPVTPSIPHMYAMERQFAVILEEGIETRWQRHWTMAVMTRRWAKERFALFAEESVCSDTLTCVGNTRGIDVAALVAELKGRGRLIGNGYGQLKEKTFRIAHMGERRPDEVAELLGAADEILGIA